jgi:hypothetical protein
MSEKQSKTMTQERVFSEKELRELSKGFVQLASEHLDAGRLDEAKYWCRRAIDAPSHVHDFLVNSVAMLLSFIYDRLGEETAAEALRQTMEKQTVKLAVPETRELKEWITWCADIARQHSPIPGLQVQEDHEKFVLTVTCPSGGRLIQEGAYDGPDGYRKFTKPGPHTWGEKDMPIYCGHCSWTHEIIPLTKFGPGSQFWVHATPFPKKPGENCLHYVYKNPENIPEEYYERLGIKKTRH